MRLWPLLVVCAWSSCSGDDSHRQNTIPPKVQPTPVVQADAGTTPAPTPAAGPTTLSEDMARPYFTGGDAGDGAQQFALHDWKGACDAFTLARGAKGLSDATAARLDLMIGLCSAEQSDWKNAARHLAIAYAQLPDLQDWVGYQLARALEYSGDHAGAFDAAKHVPLDSIAGPDAEMLVGDILRDRGDWQKTLAHYADYSKRRPDGPHESEARFRLAEATEHAGDKAAAIALYRKVYVAASLSSWASKSEKRLAALGDTAPYSVADKIARG